MKISAGVVRLIMRSSVRVNPEQLLGRTGSNGEAASGEECGPETQPGMVRASLGVYNTNADVNRAAEALTDLAERPDWYRKQYRPRMDGSGDWRHRDFSHPPDAAFSLEEEVDGWLRSVDKDVTR